ncbi:DUF6158 family protein [Gordonia liuliyuniae]|uniref:DUF6158 family protein n=1 Tax=Gordonia liuliyuniae TaxID=2911517 RepID=A0ABS9IWT3_9ACTN|nr:DUF6158 family protein [Gordonia liuliyuniae]MCF8589930.1 DUF6158 family protein [Gordonia liuliyuniae]
MTPTTGLTGRPARELSDADLEQQGTTAHETRNWVFLNGTAEQFATHTARMLELEQEYLRRHPMRTWQGSGGAASERSELDVLKQALRGILVQITALLDHEPAASGGPSDHGADPAVALLSRIAAADGGRMHKLEVHQAAREVSLERSALAKLYQSDPPLLITEQSDRVLTDAGRARLAEAGE